MERLTRAQQRTVNDNLGLCNWAVNRWGRHLPESEGFYTREDAYQDAVFGLMRAAQGFDPTLGFTFATYASAWLHQAIARGQETAYGVNWRRSRTGRGGHPDDSVPPLSLDVEFTSPRPGDDGAGLCLDPVDVLEGDDPTGDEAVAEASFAWLLGLRHRVCVDDKDLVVFDAMMSKQDGVSEASTFRGVSAEVGLGVKAVSARWAAVRCRIRELDSGVVPRDR